MYGGNKGPMGGFASDSQQSQIGIKRRAKALNTMSYILVITLLYSGRFWWGFLFCFCSSSCSSSDKGKTLSTHKNGTYMNLMGKL